VGPLHLINIKRLAYVTRRAEEAFETPLDYRAAASAVEEAPLDRPTVAAAVDRYLASVGRAVPSANPVGQALSPANPRPVDFVGEADVRAAIEQKRKIPIGPRTIVTPSARDLAGDADVLKPVQG
jgi:hypothetical protein